MDGHPYVIDDYFGQKGMLSILTILIIHDYMKNKNITIIEEHLNKYKNVHELENYFQEELDFPPSITMKKHQVFE